MESARPAQAEELPRLAELVGAAVAEASAFRGGDLLTRTLRAEDPGSVTTWLGTYYGQTARLLLAGTLDDSVVGVAALRAGTEPPVGRFDLLFVEPDGRGVGVGGALIATGTEWLRGAGCSAVDVVALPGMRSTKQFLEGTGMVARLIVMHRAI